ncbi:MAG TPA: nicotinate (nicotinamide) nucleotide adenylyltransferase, partial [Longimicrobiales bacterium]|nr:nicotinate (nicotinamide) nucleotide adenylyltransferase [Longimicrobiales bacterium]
DRLLFVPAAIPPHKQHLSVSPASVRLEMLRAAVVGNDSFEVSTTELERAGPSYTVDTLRELSAETPQRRFFLLLGHDQVRDLPTWREPEEVAQLATVCMLTRAEMPENFENSLVRQVVPVTRVDVSSTLIRHRVAEGQAIHYLVPAGVEEIIRRERLYLAV